MVTENMFNAAIVMYYRFIQLIGNSLLGIGKINNFCFSNSNIFSLTFIVKKRRKTYVNDLAD